MNALSLSVFHKARALIGPTGIAVAVILLSPLTAVGQAGPEAKLSIGVAAVVNDDPITTDDLRSRLGLIIMSSRLPDRPEVRRRFQPQVLRTLVDERLRLQEAKRLKIKVDKKEIAAAIADIERQNNLPSGGMATVLKRRGLNITALEANVLAQLTWTKIIRRQIQGRIVISETDIDDTLARLESDKGKPEFLVSEIFLQPSADQSEAQTLKFATRLVTRIRGGADFAALARTFSKSSSADAGGDLGWIRDDQLDAATLDTLYKLKRGQMSPPIKGADGYYILRMRNRRLSEGIRRAPPNYSLQQVFFKVPRDAPKDRVASALAQAAAVTAPARSCADMQRIGADKASKGSGPIPNVRFTDLQRNFQAAVTDLPIGKTSRPIRLPAGIVVLMVCARTGGDTEETIRQRARGMIVEQRAELVARRITRNLRRAALVNIRK